MSYDNNVRGGAADGYDFDPQYGPHAMGRHVQGRAQHHRGGWVDQSLHDDQYGDELEFEKWLKNDSQTALATQKY